MAAYMVLAVKRTNREAHKKLSMMVLANSGDAKVATEQLAKWENEAD